MIFRVSRKQMNRKAEILMSLEVGNGDKEGQEKARAQAKALVREHEGAAGDPPLYEIFSEEIKG